MQRLLRYCLTSVGYWSRKLGIAPYHYLVTYFDLVACPSDAQLEHNFDLVALILRSLVDHEQEPSSSMLITEAESLEAIGSTVDHKFKL